MELDCCAELDCCVELESTPELDAALEAPVEDAPLSLWDDPGAELESTLVEAGRDVEEEDTCALAEVDAMAELDCTRCIVTVE